MMRKYATWMSKCEDKVFFERRKCAQNINELMTNNDSISSLTFIFPNPSSTSKRASKQTMTHVS